MNYSISDKVVCINDTKVPSHSGEVGDYEFPDGYIEKGIVYVVNGFVTNTPHVGLRLVGLRCLSAKLGTELGWSTTRFRLLNEAINHAPLRETVYA